MHLEFDRIYGECKIERIDGERKIERMDGECRMERVRVRVRDRTDWGAPSLATGDHMPPFLSCSSLVLRYENIVSEI
jgi:hypothetical protein